VLRSFVFLQCFDAVGCMTKGIWSSDVFANGNLKLRVKLFIAVNSKYAMYQYPKFQIKGEGMEGKMERGREESG